ncbi:HD family phosphohydrolase [Gracilibacillus alcaliphilus]|uniref:HD family phosphohydrolase n=1 Tax=Gracilibacillus alcaliphilus TaxID=1401441 RepID=UPI00195AEED3|nr:HDIG domain-containing metalloprotein [Gracilibacillus alcaliphilus]MBM7674989.1 putative nucleotidyltransferase with HDIG domain [Gracilibacillus alcaliphilus]
MRFVTFIKHRGLSLFRNQALQIPACILIMMAVLFGVSYDNVHLETYEIEKFSSAQETIRSPITIENAKETERRIREAVQSVEDHYEVMPEVAEEQVTYINELFEAIQEINSGNIEVGDEKVEFDSTAEKVDYLEAFINEDLYAQMNRDNFATLFETPEETRVLTKELLTSALYDVYHDGIKTEDVEQAIETVQQKLRYSTLDESLVTALEPLMTFGVQPNSFFSLEETNQAQQQARNTVEPVMIRAGEVIAEEGQLITNEIYEELELTGLLNEKESFYPVIGLVVLVLLIGIFLFALIQNSRQQQEFQVRKLLALTILTIILALLMKVFSIYTTTTNPLYWLTPIAAFSMLIKILINEKYALTMSILYAIIGSVIFNGNIPGHLNIEAGIYLVLSQLASIFFLNLIRDRSAIIKSGVAVAGINLMVICLFIFLSFEKYSWLDYLIFGGYGIFSAFVATVLTIGMLPFFETGLGLLSDTKLLSLSSPNHPLLRKLLMEAPGTYHHSIMVANLSEASCEAIGANGLLARVAAYYHDLGKTIRPHYFIENQMGAKNPHDYLDPYQSAEIILQHPKDSANILKEAKIPKEIIDVAYQHHGTTLLKYFYYKAKEHQDNVDETAFRYEGPKPQTKEAAVVSICDSVEAAVRSLTNPDQESIEKIVNSILEDRLLDGQLNESSLTFKDLEKIKSVIEETLKGMYHSRIQYPSDEEERHGN